MKSSLQQNSLQRFSVGAAIAAILSVSGAEISQAAAPADDDGLAEVTVTGSRIVRRDAQANSPLVTVDAAELETRAGLNVESYLNELPNYNPAVTPETGNTAVFTNATATVGISTVSLRGFGSNRSLVLVDGHRVTPMNALMQVDTNSIPSSMIRSVEIISGGASATYGADAIGGVTNFILNTDYEGLRADGQWGMAEVGDAREMRFSVMGGSRLSEGRGHVTFAAEYYDRGPAFERNRDFYTRMWKSPDVGSNYLGFLLGPSDWYTGTNFQSNNPGSQSTRILTNIVDAQGRASGLNTGVFAYPGTGANASVRFLSGGHIWLPTGNNSSTFDQSKIDGLSYGYQNVYDNTYCNTAVCAGNGTPLAPIIQNLKYNETDRYSSSPQDRFAFMGTLAYDITDKLHFQGSGRFSQSRTATYLGRNTIINGWEVTVPYDAVRDSPISLDLVGNALTPQIISAILNAPGGVVPAQYANPDFIAHQAPGAHNPVIPALAMMLNNRTPTTAQNIAFNTGTGPRYDPFTAGWITQIWNDEGFDQRRTDNILTNWTIDAGLTLDLPVKDWTAELYYSRGESVVYSKTYGSISVERWRRVAASPDYGYNSSFRSNLASNNSGFNSVATPCTSGFYETIFESGAAPSKDCLYAVEAQLQESTLTQQDIMELNFQGGLFNTWADEVRGAWGYQFRRNATQFSPDILQSSASINDQAVGITPTGYLDAQMTAHDYYGELLVPLLKDSFVQKVELELGGRYSQYSATDSTFTWKALANIQFNPYVRLRGGYNRANRAPNLGEMYLPTTSSGSLAALPYGDPCSLRSNSPFGAGGALRPGEPNAQQSAEDVFVSNDVRGLAPGQTQAGAVSARLICEAQMNLLNPDPLTGTAATYYNTQPQAFNTGGGGTRLQGSTSIHSEVANTWTAGVVFASPFENAWLRNLTATLDWYKIDISDVILQYSAAYAQWLCYGSVTVSTSAEAQVQAASPECENVPRNFDTGTGQTIVLSYANQASVSTSGLDFAINWRARLADLGLSRVPGGVSLGIQGSYLDSYRTKASKANFDPWMEWKGSLGPTLSGFNGGAYTYRLLTSLGYNVNSFNVNLRWRHLPSVRTAGVQSMLETIRNNERVAASGEGLSLNYSPSSAHSVKAYDMFDLSASWTLSHTVSLRFGINNVFDKQPALTGVTDGFPQGTNLAGLCANDANCSAPTSYSLPNPGYGSTNAGFYDVMGRRYFVGARITF
jgi:outer membrane receptor protein involved in Fe transport